MRFVHQSFNQRQVPTEYLIDFEILLEALWSPEDISVRGHGPIKILREFVRTFDEGNGTVHMRQPCGNLRWSAGRYM